GPAGQPVAGGPIPPAGAGPPARPAEFLSSVVFSYGPVGIHRYTVVPTSTFQEEKCMNAEVKLGGVVPADVPVPIDIWRYVVEQTEVAVHRSWRARNGPYKLVYSESLFAAWPPIWYAMWEV